MKQQYRVIFLILVVSSLFFYWIYTTNEYNQQVAPTVRALQLSVLSRVRYITKCFDRPLVPRTQERGEYWVLYNYVRAERLHSCHETITYTTHGDYTFLDNLVPLLKKWNGPISIALYAPASDFNKTLESILYLRDCTDPLIKQLVTFHIYFPKSHLPTWVPTQSNLLNISLDCVSSVPPYENVSSNQLYKAQRELIYPINVGRNIARETAQTHFVLASDIELYPSVNLIPEFLSMIADSEGTLLAEDLKVFPLHIFEVESKVQVPENKSTLQKMLANGTAIPFHKRMCPLCHKILKSSEWQQKELNNSQIYVFDVGKRSGSFNQWEPIFIGTHSDPLYDERMSWEGKSDKMTQAYVMCVLDYDFLILDNAFLAHRPGIKNYKADKKRDQIVWRTNTKLLPIIKAELEILFGTKEGCVVRR